MWGPAVSRPLPTSSSTGVTDVVDVSDLGLDRFDEHGRSQLAPDPIALPFPERTLCDHHDQRPRTSPDARTPATSRTGALLEEATGEPMQTPACTIWEDGDASAGIWECTAGPSRWLLETHEVIHLVAGRMTVTARRRRADRDQRRRRRGLPARLVRHVGHPRDRPQGLRDLLTRQLTTFGR